MLSIYASKSYGSHSQEIRKRVRLLTPRSFLSIPVAWLQVTEQSAEAYAYI